MKSRWVLLTIVSLAVVLTTGLCSGVALAEQAKIADPAAIKAADEVQVNKAMLDGAQIVPNGDNGDEPTDDVPPEKNDDYDGPKAPPKTSGSGNPGNGTPKTDAGKEKTPETKETPKTRKTLPYTGGDATAYTYLGAVIILFGTGLLGRKMILRARES